MPMKYYREAQQKRQQQKYLKAQQLRIKKAEENLEKTLKQISCRTLKYCKNGDTQKCFICKWNQACIHPKDDFYIAKIPGIKVLP